MTSEEVLARRIMLLIYLACFAWAIRLTRRLMASVGETARWVHDWREEDRR